MTVRELRAALKGLPPYAHVSFVSARAHHEEHFISMASSRIEVEKALGWYPIRFDQDNTHRELDDGDLILLADHRPCLRRAVFPPEMKP